MIAFNNKSPDRKTDDAFRIFENKSPQMSEVLLSLSRLFQSLCDMNQPPTPDKIPSLPKWSQIPNRDQSGRFQPRQGKLPKNRATWDKLTMQMLRAVSRHLFEDCRGCGSLSHIGTKFELVELFIRRKVKPEDVRKAYINLKETACKKRKISVRIK